MNLQVTAFAVLSFHVLQVYDLTSSNEYCDGAGMSPVNCSSSSTQLGLCWFDQHEHTWNRTDIFCKFLQEDNGRCSSDGKDQLCVEVCTNNTNWETGECKTSASVCHHLTQCQCTPGNLSVLESMTYSDNVTLTWSQSLSKYSISCCPAPYNNNMTVCILSNSDEPQNDENSAIITGLKPYTSYECCVCINGQQMCRSVRTTEAAPGPPTHLNAAHVMGNVFLLTWKAPEEQTGVIQSYYIEINSHGQGEDLVILNEMTEGDDLYLLVHLDQLTEGLEYTFKVAANTTEMGDYSNRTLIKVPSSQGEMVPLSQGKMLTLILGFIIGLVILILIVETIVAATVCNRMRKQNKSLTREVQEYEMTSKYSAVRHDTGSLPDRYLAIKKRDSNRKQPLYPPAHLAADYLTPTMTRTTGPVEEKKKEEKMKTDESKNTDSESIEKTETNETCGKDSEENPYQSLIVSTTDNTRPTPDGYIKIRRSGVDSLEEGTLPPKLTPVTPKPEPDYPLKSLIPQLSLASDLPPKSENMYTSTSGTS